MVEMVRAFLTSIMMAPRRRPMPEPMRTKRHMMVVKKMKVPPFSARPTIQ
jgi:hypothetical protein